MNTQRSSAALRTIIVAAVSGVEGDSLNQLSSYELPDGAQVYVLATRSAYRLDKTSSATASAVVVAPGAGPGRFIFAGGLSGAGSFQMIGTAALTGATTATDDIWSTLPSGSGFYQSLLPAGFWSVSTTSGLATYSGPDQVVLATAIVTVASAVAAQALELAITSNAALIGTSTADYAAGVANVPPTTPGLAVQLTTQRLFSVTQGTTLGLAIRDTSASNNITVSRANLIISAG